MEPIFVTFIVFGTIGLILYRWIETRHKERIAMIEKGVNPADFRGLSVKDMFRKDMFRMNPLSSLKWGLLAMFVGGGLMVGTYLEQNLYWHDSVYPASMLIFGGLALILFYGIASRKMKQE